MKRMANHYFKIHEHTVALLEDSPRGNQPPPLERRSGEEKGESLTAPYGGLERRQSLREKKLSTIPEEKECKKEYLIATYWG